MNCPVCNRLWATALSVCPSCGSDIYSDESQLEIIGVTTRVGSRQPLVLAESAAVASVEVPALAEPPAAEPAVPGFTPVVGSAAAAVAVARVQPSAQKSIVTGSLRSSNTSPTLVGLHRSEPAVPEWRVQMQNAVRKRKGAQPTAVVEGDHDLEFAIDGATALRPRVVRTPEAAPTPTITDPLLANAMRRIEDSRKAFLEPAPTAPVRDRPFGVVAPTGGAARPSERSAALPKPRLVGPTPIVAVKRDTNKLPPIETVVSPAEMSDEPRTSESLPSPEFAEIKLIRIKAENPVIADSVGRSTDEIEDLAPISMRFGAGVFDLIIGFFASLLILSPLAFARDDWFTVSGLITLLGVSALVLFLYMTVCLGFFGKTLGMRLFSLELVDAVENEYPTLRQAAVNSSVFLLLLGFAGAGFLTLFYNEEKRALHDLLSGTILVREF